MFNRIIETVKYKGDVDITVRRSDINGMYELVAFDDGGYLCRMKTDSYDEGTIESFIEYMNKQEL